jgi:leucyl aminopeptidase
LKHVRLLIHFLSKSIKIALIGLGDGTNIDDSYTKIGAAIASKCNESKAEKCSFVCSTDLSSISLSDLTVGFYTGLYSDNRYRTGENVKALAEKLDSVTIVAEGGVADYDAAIASIESGKAIAAGVSLTKDIVNAPHNVLNSESLANVARKIAEESGGTIKCIILGKEECEKRGMGAYLGVARGSETEPQFIHLTYSPKSGNVKKKVGIVGKGLLFDTGGYNIKTAMMELMKFDCGGSVSAIAITIAITIEIVIVKVFANCDYYALIVI